MEVKWRYVYAIAVMLVTMGNYICRQNINIAIVDMTTSQTRKSNEPGFCDVDNILYRHVRVSVEAPTSPTRKPSIELTSDEKYDWSPEQVGTLLGCYYWGYCVSMLPGAVLAQKYGFYSVILISSLVNALLTLFFPLFIRIGGFPAAVMSRVLLGAASGPLMPSIQGSWHWWSLPGEVSTMIAIQTTGVVLGNMIGQGGTGYVSSRFGWQMAFTCSGLLMLIFSLLWILLVSNRPDHHNVKLVCFVKRKFAIVSHISPDEVQLIVEHRQVKSENRVPWREILSSRPLHTATFVWFAMTYTIYTSTNNIPLFLASVHGLTTDSIGAIFGTVALLTAVVGVPAAIVADKLRQRMTTTKLRKGVCALLSLFTIVGFISIINSTCHTQTVIVSIAIMIMASATISTVGLKPITADMSGQFASVVYGLVNTVGNAAGFLSSQIMGLILTGKNISDPATWVPVFAIPCALFTISMIIFIAFGDVELQPWAKEAVNGDDEKKENEITSSEFLMYK